MGKAGISKIPREKRPIALGMMLDALDEEERACMMKTIPAPMRLLMPLMIDRPWKKYAATLRTGGPDPARSGVLGGQLGLVAAVMAESKLARHWAQSRLSGVSAQRRPAPW